VVEVGGRESECFVSNQVIQSRSDIRRHRQKCSGISAHFE
jgi:hypothetical protein